jgi:uncharacterized membrane protein (UPF0127 family)
MKWRFKKGDRVLFANKDKPINLDEVWIVTARVPKEDWNYRGYGESVSTTAPYYEIRHATNRDAKAGKIRELELTFEDPDLRISRPIVLENIPIFQPHQWEFKVGDYVVPKGSSGLSVDDRDVVDRAQRDGRLLEEADFVWMKVVRQIPMYDLWLAHENEGYPDMYRWYEVAYTPQGSASRKIYYHTYPEKVLTGAHMDLRTQSYFKLASFQPVELLETIETGFVVRASDQGIVHTAEVPELAEAIVPVVVLNDRYEAALGFKDEGPNAHRYASHALLFPNGRGAYTMRGVSYPLVLVSLDKDGIIQAAQLMRPNEARYESHPTAKDVVEVSPPLFQSLGWKIGDRLVVANDHLIKHAYHAKAAK